MMAGTARLTAHGGQPHDQVCKSRGCVLRFAPAIGIAPTPGGCAGTDPSGSSRWVSGPIPHLHGRYPTGPLGMVSPRGAMPKKITAIWPFGRHPHVLARLVPDQAGSGASQ